MNKKKCAKITGIVVGVLLVLLIAIPWAFQGKIATLVRTEGNKMLNAEFDFRSLDISLIKHFPNASLSLEDFWLKGQGAFEQDTLVNAGKVTVTVNLFSLFGDSGFDLSRIYIDNTRLHAIVLKNGQANWDVMKTDSTETEDATEQDTTASAFRIKLQQVQLNDVTLVYDDRTAGMYAEAADIDLKCRGDFSAAHSMLQLEGGIDAFTFRTGGMPLLNHAKIEAEINADADFAAGKYTLKENSITLNAIRANIDGWTAVQKNGDLEMDLKLNTNEVGFKELLSLIPAIYAKDFEKLKTDGSASLSAWAKGTLQGDSIVPAFNLDLQVKDGMFRYPQLPTGVDQIQITANVQNPGGPTDGTTVTIKPFSFRLGNNPFSLTAFIKTPVSDPDFQAEAKGTINLGMIKEVYPLEDMELNGVVQADMNVAGRLSYVEKEQYERVSAGGTVGLSNMKLKLKDMPDIDIRKSLLSFTPQYLSLSETTVNIGKNDLTADSRFENYMGYALKGTTLKGSLNIRSNRMNLNDFMTATPDSIQPEQVQETTTENQAPSLIIVPKNIDFVMKADMKQVLFDNMKFDNVKGNLIVKNGVVDMNNLSFNTMGGSVVLNGDYSTADPQKPTMDAGFKMTNMNFAQTYKELNMVRNMAPIFENLKGNFSGNIHINTALDQTMSPVLETMKGGGNLSTKDLSLSGVKAIDGIADAIGKPEMKNLTVNDMNIDFTIENGRIATQPFDLKMGEYTLNLSGTTGLDQSIDYSGKIKLPASSGKMAGISTFDLKLGGTFTSPTIKVDAASMANQALQSAGEKVLDKLTEKMGGKDTTNSENGEKKNVVNKVLDLFKKKK